MKSTTFFIIAAIAGAWAGGAHAQTAAEADELARGRYLSVIGGCNDCHTQGYARAEGKVPQSRWLTGSGIGAFGPWGTTYPSNLRLTLQSLSADQWVHYARNLRTRPPMPWFKLHEFSEVDLRALHAFIRTLGEPGPPAPAGLPPGVEPPQPFVRYPGPPVEAKP